VTPTARLQRIEKRLKAHEPPPAFAYVDPVTFAREQLHFTPDPWQERVLRWAGLRLLLNCSRQSGKSSITAILALYYALYVAKSLILLISPTLRQSGELFKKVQDFLARLPARPALTEDNKLSLQLTNGSRIVSLPGNEANIRGFSAATLIIEDESARTPDELFYAVKPMLAVSGGRHVLMSTPWGPRGHFYEAWENGGAEWERIRVPASDCSRIPAAFLAAERRAMPERWYDSEYNCLFVDVEGAVFRFDDLLSALSDDVEPFVPLAPSPGGFGSAPPAAIVETDHSPPREGASGEEQADPFGAFGGGAR
jgi:hypothetical protein